MDYLKYYFLEEYLLKEVRGNFEKRGFLTPEEFFCIIIWKSNRAKTAIKRKLLKFNSDLRKAVKNLSSEIFNEKSNDKKLEILLNNWKFQLPVASAILTILYPDDFSVYDIRVRNELGIKDFCGSKDQIEKYFSEFLPRVDSLKRIKKLRDKDRYLWAKSFYKDLEKFLQAN